MIRGVCIAAVWLNRELYESSPAEVLASAGHFAEVWGHPARVALHLF